MVTAPKCFFCGERHWSTQECKGGTASNAHLTEGSASNNGKRIRRGTTDVGEVERRAAVVIHEAVREDISESVGVSASRGGGCADGSLANDSVERGMDSGGHAEGCGMESDRLGGGDRLLKQRWSRESYNA